MRKDEWSVEGVGFLVVILIVVGLGYIYPKNFDLVEGASSNFCYKITIKDPDFENCSVLFFESSNSEFTTIKFNVCLTQVQFGRNYEMSEKSTDSISTWFQGVGSYSVHKSYDEENRCIHIKFVARLSKGVHTIATSFPTRFHTWPWKFFIIVN